jgi:hypothetical protein
VSGRATAKQVRHALEAFDSTADPLESLAAARRLREAAETLELAVVAELRHRGATWARIGAVYGTTKQGAQQRFRAALAARSRGDEAPNPTAGT